MRILFDISKIDNLLNFSNKKNIGIVNRESKNNNNNNNNNLYSHLHNFVLTITVLGKTTFQAKEIKPY
jgi:hypothetical protein